MLTKSRWRVVYRGWEKNPPFRGKNYYSCAMNKHDALVYLEIFPDAMWIEKIAGWCGIGRKIFKRGV